MSFSGGSAGRRLALTAWRRAGTLGAAAVLAAVATLAAAGTAAARTAAAKPAPLALALSPAPYNYGQVTVRQPASQTFTLANSGTRATGKLTVTLTGAAAFTITASTCKNLAPGKTCTITVEFTPTTSGTVTATLTAASKKTATATDTLIGTGKELGSVPGLSFTPAAYDFGTRFTGKAVSQTFTLTNSTGAATGTLTVGLPPGGSPEFAVTSNTCTGTSLANGQTCTVTVQFAPFIAGGVFSLLRAAVSGDSDAATAIIEGTGVAPHIYWADSPSSAAGSGSISWAGLNGANPQSIIGGLHAPAGVAVTNSHLYWTVSLDGTIGEANLDGSSPHTIVSGQNRPSGIAADASHLYWTDEGDGTIWEANLDGSDPQAIIQGQNGPAGIAVDASHLYWANGGGFTSGSGTINEAGLTGANPSPHAIFSGQNGPIGVAVGGGQLYWATALDGTVWKASLSSANPTPQAFITGQSAPIGVAVTSSQLFWTAIGTVNAISLNGGSLQPPIVSDKKGPELIAVPPA